MQSAKTGFIAAIAIGALGSSLLIPTAANAATTISDAALLWAGSGTQQGIAYANGCDHFSAGLSDGSSANYRTHEGNVYILRELADGTIAPITWSNRCDNLGPQNADGDATIGQRIVFTAGTGTVQDDGSATISWDGDASINAYGGIAPWSISDPTLNIDASGNGTLTGTLSGYATSQASADTKTPLNSVSNVVIATMEGVSIVDGEIRIEPEFEGIDYYPLNVTGDPSQGRRETSAIPESRKGEGMVWGSWPESFVDFQYQTGLSTYWHTSGMTADPHKAPEEILVDTDFELPDLSPTVTGPVNPVNASSGENAVLTAPVVANPWQPVTWQKRSQGTQTWTTIPGETGPELNLGAVSTSDNGTEYRVSVSDKTSSSGLLTVTAAVPVTITTEPKDLSVEDHSNVKLSVAATGSALRYQWQEYIDGTWVDLFRAVNTSYSFISALDTPRRTFRVLVSNGVGDPAVSREATVKVKIAPAVITKHPADISSLVSSAEKYTLTAEASGSPEPSWIWQRSDDAGLTWTNVSEPSSVSRSTSFELNTRSDRFNAGDDGAMYRAMAENGSDEPAYTNPATLSLRDVTGKSISTTYEAGASKITVNLEGYPTDRNVSGALAVIVTKAGVWEPGQTLSGDQILGQETYALSTLAVYGGNRTFTISLTEPLVDSESYEVVTYAINYVDNADYQGRHTVGGKLPVVESHPETVQDYEGHSVTLSVSATSDSDVSYQWQKLLNDDPWWEDVAGATSAELKLAGVLDSDAVYRVKVTNTTGSVTSHRAAVRVLAWEPLSVSNPTSAKVTAGQSATFSVTAGGSLPTVTWERKSASSNTWTAIAQATSDKLLLKNVTAKDDGTQVRAVVTNERESVASSAATLHVERRASKVTVKVAKAKTAFGVGTRATVSLSPLQAGRTVSVYVDGTKVGSGAAKSGRVTVSLPKNTRVGRHTVSASVAASDLDAAASGSASWKVRKAKAKKVTLLVSRAKVKAGARPKAIVRVSSLDNAARYVGTVKVLRGKKVFASKKMTAKNRNRVSIRLPRVTKTSSFKVQVGSKTVKTRTSKAVKVRVVR